MSTARDRLLHVLTSRHEKWVTSPYLGSEPLLIREPTANERLLALEAAQREDGEQPDNTLYRALLIQLCVVDPTTGTPYADGRRDPTTGDVAIDPRTRAPLFTPDDIAALLEAREFAVVVLVNEITALAKLLPGEFPGSHQAPDVAERNAGAGAETGDAQPGSDAG